jgi:ferredoxin
MPKPRVLQKYEVDESRCILCGICVDACPYDALRDGADIELSHTSRENPMIDLMAIAAVDRETEVTYIRRERDWATRAAAQGRIVDNARMLPVLPATIGGIAGGGHGNAAQPGNGNAALPGGGTAIARAHHE